MNYDRPTARELRAGETAAWGGRAEPDMRVRLLAWKSVKKNSLCGFASVLVSPPGARFHDCPVHVSHGKAWCALPSKPQIDSDGRLRKDNNGKTQYVPVVEWDSRELRDRFSRAVVQLIRTRHPGALDDGGA
jgi:hypothetical protein